jgi:hypothetical protein
MRHCASSLAVVHLRLQYTAARHQCLHDVYARCLLTSTTIAPSTHITHHAAAAHCHTYYCTAVPLGRRHEEDAADD